MPVIKEAENTQTPMCKDTFGAIEVAAGVDRTRVVVILNATNVVIDVVELLETENGKTCGVAIALARADAEALSDSLMYASTVIHDRLHT